MRTLMGSAHATVTIACTEYYKQYNRHVYVTPKSYLSFLEGYSKLYSNKLKETRGLASSINSGLQKMSDAKLDVGRMKVGAVNLDPSVGAANSLMCIFVMPRACLCAVERTTIWPSVLLINLFMHISMTSFGSDVKDILVDKKDAM